MNNTGFTMVEVLTVVVIVAVLVAIAAPQYTKSIERARATEAMGLVKNINDAVYTYAAARTGENACADTFHKLVVSLPVTNDKTDTLTTSNFIYRLNDPAAPFVPGTVCHGATATRLNGGANYDYVIWNPFTSGQTGKAPALGCYSPSGKEASVEVCQSLGIYKESM